MTDETGRPRRRRTKQTSPARPAEGSAKSQGTKSQDAKTQSARRSAVRAPRADRPRRMLFTAGALLIAGLAMVGIGPSELGKWTTLVGMIALIYGIHTLGRTGPPDPIDAR